MKSSLESKISVIESIKNNVSSCTLFQLLWYIEQLSDTLLKYKENLRVIKDKKTLIEAEITIKVNTDDNIKATNKKSVIEITKSENEEYVNADTECNNLKYLIDSIENLIKIITLKYKLIEPAFHINGVLTYQDLEREYKK